MRVRKPWTEWDDSLDPRELPGAMGIFELADAERRTLYIGKAGPRQPFGIRGELVRHFCTPERLAGANWSYHLVGRSFPSIAGRARYYRYEVNHQYYGRWVEALARFREDWGTLPPANLEDPEEPPPLGSYHWRSVNPEP
jgi:hypothetical protein